MQRGIGSYRHCSFDLHDHQKGLKSSSTLLKFPPFSASIAGFCFRAPFLGLQAEPPSYHVRFSMANLRTDSPVSSRIVRAFLDFLNSGLYFSLFFRSLFFFWMILLNLAVLISSLFTAFFFFFVLLDLLLLYLFSVECLKMYRVGCLCWICVNFSGVKRCVVLCNVHYHFDGFF